MKFTVHYIPLDKIKSDEPVTLTERIRKLRAYIWDCMHVIAVRRNKKDGSFTILSGHERFVYLRDHTRKQSVPCIVDDNKMITEIESYIDRLLNRKGTAQRQSRMMNLPLLTASWLIIRAFLKLEPRFSSLSYRQQWKVILLAIQTKRTVIHVMKAKVDELLSDKSK